MASEDWNMKWRTTFQDNLVGTMSLTRQYKKPTEEQFKEISSALAMARECLMYWKSGTASWDSVHAEMPLDQTKLEEQKKYLEAGMSAREGE